MAKKPAAAALAKAKADAINSPEEDAERQAHVDRAMAEKAEEMRKAAEGETEKQRKEAEAKLAKEIEARKAEEEKQRKLLEEAQAILKEAEEAAALATKSDEEAGQRWLRLGGYMVRLTEKVSNTKLHPALIAPFPHLAAILPPIRSDAKWMSENFDKEFLPIVYKDPETGEDKTEEKGPGTKGLKLQHPQTYRTNFRKRQEEFRAKVLEDWKKANPERAAQAEAKEAEEKKSEKPVAQDIVRRTMLAWCQEFQIKGDARELIVAAALDVNHNGGMKELRNVFCFRELLDEDGDELELDNEAIAQTVAKQPGKKQPKGSAAK